MGEMDFIDKLFFNGKALYYNGLTTLQYLSPNAYNIFSVCIY